MKKIIRVLAFSIVVFILSMCCFATDYVYNTANNKDLTELELFVGGMPFGVKIQSIGLQIIKFDESNSPAQKAGLKLGDIIIKVNEKSIKTIEDYAKEIEKAGNKPTSITILRNNSELNYKITPIYSENEGKYKTGIWVKDSTSGIGTITYINSKNEFGGLGHGICDGNNGNIIPISKGTVLDVKINGALKGQIGKPGELKGTFNAKKIGALFDNTPQGVFGILTTQCKSPENKMKICPKDDIQEGSAYIWCTLDNDYPQKYSIEISNIDLSNNNTKNFKIKVTDKRLLEKTGGIVQGMSGSPIIQNGKLVGAVTHVLINNPTEGYGIFIENMLSAMSSSSK